jgi:hypothetical protein
VSRSLCSVSLGLVLVLVACSAQEAPPTEAAVDQQATPPAITPEPRSEPEDADPTPRDCRQDRLEDTPFVALGGGGDPLVTSVELVRLTHRCADTAVVVADHGWTAALAVAVATEVDAPLLLADPDAPRGHTAAEGVAAEIDRLDPASIITLGLPSAPTSGEDPARVERTAIDVSPGIARTVGSDAALALAVIEYLGADRAYAVPADDRVARAAAVARNGGTTPLLPVPEDDDDLAGLSAELPPALRVEVVARDESAARALADRLVDVGIDAEPARGPTWEPGSPDTLWLVDPAQASTAAVVAATAAGRGDRVLPIHASDLRLGRSRAALVAEAAPDRTVVVGDVTELAEWQLPLLVDGARLPTGGLTLFDGERMVALYGTPGSTALGVLGEAQDLDATVARAREVAEPYGADGVRVVPAFELITTIASAEPEADGDYSRRVDPDTLWPWIERAAEEGFYVILDLQPGRTDFLAQAQEYEELLREPHVGLALDPEWRLEDDQVHLRQIGSVAAEEVQRVADWLAELTREHRLPQKLLVLHQFRHTMLPDRDTITAPPELAVVVHMDGQGALSTKYETYRSLTAGTKDRWLWGWKNFYDEDDPTATPEQVLELDPLPVLITYQ